MSGLTLSNLAFVGSLTPAIVVSNALTSILQPTPGPGWQHYTQGGGIANYFVEDVNTIRIEVVNPGNGANAIQFRNTQGILVNGRTYMIHIRAKAAIAYSAAAAGGLTGAPYTAFEPPYSIALTPTYQDFNISSTPTGMANNTGDAIPDFNLGGSAGNIFWFQVQVN